MFEPAHSLRPGAPLRRRQPSEGCVNPERVFTLLPDFALPLGRTR